MKIIENFNKGKLKMDFDSIFTLISVDWEEDGDIETYIFRANVISHDKAVDLVESFNEAYDNGEYEASFEDYLSENDIEYMIV